MYIYLYLQLVELQTRPHVEYVHARIGSIVKHARTMQSTQKLAICLSLLENNFD